MSDIFLKLLNLSITTSWLIFAIIIIRSMLKKAPKWMNCALWALVAIRLVCPISIESVLSLIPSSEPIPHDIALERNPAINSGIPTLNQIVNPVIAQHFTPDPVSSANPLQIVVSVSSFMWMVGMIALLLYAFISYIRLKRSVGASISLENDILACDEVKSPFILGIFKPIIYVPSSMSGETLRYVLMHEKAHLKRYDHLWKPIGYILLTVYWFNPLCWIAYILLCRDIEMACDEKVIRDMDHGGKAAYSQALFDCSFPRKRIAACPLAFGEVGVKERVSSVLHYKKPAFLIILAAIILVIIIAVLFLTSPKNDTSENIGHTPETNKNSVVENNETVTESESWKEMIEVSAPNIDLSATTGADGSKIYYADEHIFIFGGYYGLFVYDVETNQIVRSVDLASIGCNITQGDDACEIYATTDGSKVILSPLSGNMMYVYSVVENQMWMEPYNLATYDLYKAQYTEENEYGKRASYEKNGEIKHYCLVNDITIGELGYAMDIQSSYHTIFGASIQNEENSGIVHPQVNQEQDSKNTDGTPSRAYVEALQENISADMVAGQLPFVVSSAIRENPLRLEVALTEMTEKNIATIYSYETNGSAITLIQSSGAIQELQTTSSDAQSEMAPRLSKEDENLGVEYKEQNGRYVVDGDMVFRDKMVLTGKNSSAMYPV